MNIVTSLRSDSDCNKEATYLLTYFLQIRTTCLTPTDLRLLLNCKLHQQKRSHGYAGSAKTKYCWTGFSYFWLFWV